MRPGAASRSSATHLLDKGGGLRHWILLATALWTTGVSFAWGPGHDVVGKSVLDKVGPEWANRLNAVDRNRFLRATHLPDNGDPNLFGEKCRAYLVSHGMGGKSTYGLHKPPLRMALFNALVAAMVDDRDEDVAIVTAALSHALACNKRVWHY